VATVHALAGPGANKKAQQANPTTPAFPSLSDDVIGNFTFVAPTSVDEQVTITPLLTPDPEVYQAAMLALINSVQESLYIQLQYIHPTKVPTESKFTELLDALAAKINAGKDVRIILSQFQKPKGGLEALQAAGVSLKNVRIQNKVHNKGFVFDHKKVVVSSMNWSGEGVLANRDAGVVIDNATAAQYYERVFLDDWNNHAKQQQ
jgi:phosphatidylserine/phosphatidylglycerophosphate/cardiolipin synthase-like enzyme